MQQTNEYRLHHRYGNSNRIDRKNQVNERPMVTTMSTPLNNRYVYTVATEANNYRSDIIIHEFHPFESKLHYKIEQDNIENPNILFKYSVNNNSSPNDLYNMSDMMLNATNTANILHRSEYSVVNKAKQHNQNHSDVIINNGSNDEVNAVGKSLDLVTRDEFVIVNLDDATDASEQVHNISDEHFNSNQPNEQWHYNIMKIIDEVPFGKNVNNISLVFSSKSVDEDQVNQHQTITDHIQSNKAQVYTGVDQVSQYDSTTDHMQSFDIHNYTAVDQVSQHDPTTDYKQSNVAQDNISIDQISHIDPKTDHMKSFATQDYMGVDQVSQHSSRTDHMKSLATKDCIGFNKVSQLDPTTDHMPSITTQDYRGVDITPSIIFKTTTIAHNHIHNMPNVGTNINTMVVLPSNTEDLINSEEKNLKFWNTPIGEVSSNQLDHNLTVASERATRFGWSTSNENITKNNFISSNNRISNASIYLEKLGNEYLRIYPESAEEENVLTTVYSRIESVARAFCDLRRVTNFDHLLQEDGSFKDLLVSWGELSTTYYLLRI